MNPSVLESDAESSRVGHSTGLSALPRMQSDLWNQLRDAVRRLGSENDKPDDERAMRALVESLFPLLAVNEHCFAFPGISILGHLQSLYERQEWKSLRELTLHLAYMRARGTYAQVDLARAKARDFLELVTNDFDAVKVSPDAAKRPYFEVLVVDEVAGDDEGELRKQVRQFRMPNDAAIFELVIVHSFEDALRAVIANPAIAACVLRYSFPFASRRGGPDTDTLARVYDVLNQDRDGLRVQRPGQRTTTLAALIHRLRPELDLYRVTNAPVENVVGSESAVFRRIFFQAEDYLDLHTTILHGVSARFDTPFFDAIRQYSARPTGMFHALPVSRGRTIAKSNWIKDFGEFYGPQLFLAETSATAGGLDSLLQPTGPLREAQRLAARAFGAHKTFFVTNGTSTANKIVFQALVRPGDFVLIGHDCHKSHPYASILSGACPVYLDGYPVTELSMYGGVPLREIKQRLLEIRAAGALHRVKMLLLTNITFDGITYDPYRVMKELLAIHPGLYFLWDEAWFAYGRFNPLLARRTAMVAAARLEVELRSAEYRTRYDQWKTSYAPETDDAWLDGEILPDPDQARVRVYATHSTHKTLTALRQGSMIHVYDGAFDRRVARAFSEAYMTHTSTSPNYQILASLDVGRRQVELEGFGLVSESVDLALLLRERVQSDPLLARYFKVASPAAMIPSQYRPSALDRYLDPVRGRAHRGESWREDEFVLDPTRVTLQVSGTGMDGDSFRHLLMDRHSIHINKTSRNSVLFLIHIGAARGTVAHLVKVLTQIASETDAWLERATDEETQQFRNRVRALTEELPPLPDFSGFHPRFSDSDYPRAGNLREAYFLGLEYDACEHIPVDDELRQRIAKGEQFVAAGFITPYPPGFPILVPGQVVSQGIVGYLLALDVKEIHGLDASLGLRVLRKEVLDTTPPSIAPTRPKGQACQPKPSVASRTSAATSTATNGRSSS